MKPRLQHLSVEEFQPVSDVIKYWCHDGEQAWFSRGWSILRKYGLTYFIDDFSKCICFIRGLALIRTLRTFTMFHAEGFDPVPWLHRRSPRDPVHGPILPLPVANTTSEAACRLGGTAQRRQHLLRAVALRPDAGGVPARSRGAPAPAEHRLDDLLHSTALQGATGRHRSLGRTAISRSPCGVPPIAVLCGPMSIVNPPAILARYDTTAYKLPTTATTWIEVTLERLTAFFQT